MWSRRWTLPVPWGFSHFCFNSNYSVRKLGEVFDFLDLSRSTILIFEKYVCKRYVFSVRTAILFHFISDFKCPMQLQNLTLPFLWLHTKVQLCHLLYAVNFDAFMWNVKARWHWTIRELERMGVKLRKDTMDMKQEGHLSACAAIVPQTKPIPAGVSVTQWNFPNFKSLQDPQRSKIRLRELSHAFYNTTFWSN